MKIKRFNESLEFGQKLEIIDQILNIARDEGLYVYEPETARSFGWTSHHYIDRYPYQSEAPDEPYNDPIMSNEKFIEIVTNIYDRLDVHGLILHYKSPLKKQKTARFDTRGGGTTHDIHTDIPANVDITCFFFDIDINI
jgi:hypothetical protein